MDVYFFLHKYLMTQVNTDFRKLRTMKILKYTDKPQRKNFLSPFLSNIQALHQRLHNNVKNLIFFCLFTHKCNSA